MICQGCILSPCLFNLYAEYIMRNAGLEEAQVGIKIAGRNINNLGYADAPPSSFPLFLHRILFTFVRAAEHTPVSQRSLACLIPALGLLGACAQHRSRGEEADCRAGSQPRGPQAFFCACSSAPLPVTTWSSLLLLSEDFEASKWRVVLLAVQGANPPSSACLLPSLPSFARCPLATCPGLSLVPHVHYCSRNLLSHSSKCLNGSFSLGVACGILVL